MFSKKKIPKFIFIWKILATEGSNLPNPTIIIGTKGIKFCSISGFHICKSSKKQSVIWIDAVFSDFIDHSLHYVCTLRTVLARAIYCRVADVQRDQAQHKQKHFQCAEMISMCTVFICKIRQEVHLNNIVV